MANIPPLSLAIIGSRSFKDYHLLKSTIDDFIKEHQVREIVSGGAIGADSLAEIYARENNIKMTVLKPDWKAYGKSAGFLRNTDIINESDVVIAFWDGRSPGTKNSIETARKQDKPVFIIKF